MKQKINLDTMSATEIFSNEKICLLLKDIAFAGSKHMESLRGVL